MIIPSLRASLQAQQGKEALEYLVLKRRGGAPSGAVTFIITGGMGVSTPIIIS